MQAKLPMIAPGQRTRRSRRQRARLSAACLCSRVLQSKMEVLFFMAPTVLLAASASTRSARQRAPRCHRNCARLSRIATRRSARLPSRHRPSCRLPSLRLSHPLLPRQLSSQQEARRRLLLTCRLLLSTSTASCLRLSRLPFLRLGFSRPRKPVLAQACLLHSRHRLSLRARLLAFSLAA